MPPAARITDMHTCPLVSGVVPHVGGPVITGEPTVIVAGVPQARISDKCTCAGPPDVIVKGSPTVLVGGLPAARMGDMTAHGGVIVTGAPNVLIGEAGAGAGAPVVPPVLSAICQQLAEAQAENRAARDNALLASAAYGDPNAKLPENTRPATQEDLIALGLHDGEHDMTRIADSNFRSEVFVRTDPTTGQKSYVVAFKGTDMLSGEDWATNARQGLGQETAYYNQAMEIGTTANDSAPGRVSFVGHSLGGGLASAAATVTQNSEQPATAHTFNAAGLHPATVDRYGAEITEDLPVQAYYVEGDILNATQDSTPIPPAVGHRRPLTPARDSTWTDYAGGAGGALLGALKGGVGATVGGVAGHEAARGSRLHMMSSVHEALAAQAEDINTQQDANGCP
jgi:uncharacterized Zn-binding protein involved in type VI secretion